MGNLASHNYERLKNKRWMMLCLQYTLGVCVCLRCIKRYGDGEIWLLLETKSHSAAKRAKGTADAMWPFRL